jgi:hypothetical protein
LVEQDTILNLRTGTLFIARQYPQNLAEEIEGLQQWQNAEPIALLKRAWTKKI